MEQRFTDEELAFLRQARFGDLPERVLPTELVELVETDPPRADETPPDYRNLYAAG